MASTTSGYQPRNTPAERRAFFDQQRLVTDLRAVIDAANTAIAALQATVADHEARITALEPP